MLTKEDFRPARADRLLFELAPFVSVFFALVAFASIPFGDTLTSRRPRGAAAGGHAQRRHPLRVRHALAGRVRRDDGGLVVGQQLRAAGRPAGGGPDDLGRDRHRRLDHGRGDDLRLAQPAGHRAGQGKLLWGWLPAWGIVTQPLAFILFLTAGIAATKRIPFDTPEGESEIIGYFVEYSGMKFGMFLMTDMVETIVLAGLTHLAVPGRLAGAVTLCPTAFTCRGAPASACRRSW